MNKIYLWRAAKDSLKNMLNEALWKTEIEEIDATFIICKN